MEASLIVALASAAPEERLTAVLEIERRLGRLLDEGLTADRFADLVTVRFPELLPALVGALGDPHKGVQVTAANCLEFLAYQTPAVVPLLRTAMTYAAPDKAALANAVPYAPPWRAWGAAIVGARLNLWLPEMGAALVGALGAQDRDVRWAAAHSLVALGRTHGEAVAAALGALQAPEPVARRMAAYCLGAMGAYAPVEQALTGALADAAPDVRRAAVLGLDKFPSLQPETLGQIGALRSDPDPFVQRTATAVVGKRRGA